MAARDNISFFIMTPSNVVGGSCITNDDDESANEKSVKRVTRCMYQNVYAMYRNALSRHSGRKITRAILYAAAC